MKRRILTALLVVLVALGALFVSNYVKTSPYDRARMRTARQNDGNLVAMADSGAYNLFAFNTDQINSDELQFPHNLEREFTKLDLDGFYNPIEFYMEYQGHDWGGPANDQHRIVFNDGSSVISDIYGGVLRVRYYNGWRIVAMDTLLSDEMRELYVLPTGQKLWRDDGRVFCFSFDYENAWIFERNTAYHCEKASSRVESVGIPFDYDEMVRWCGLNSGVLTFATYDGKGGVIWLFKNGECTQIYASPTADPDPDWFTASNYESALLDGEIIYDLPDGRVTITSNGDIVRGK